MNQSGADDIQDFQMGAPSAHHEHESSRILDALSCYLSLILKHFDPNGIKLQLIKIRGGGGGGGGCMPAMPLWVRHYQSYSLTKNILSNKDLICKNSSKIYKCMKLLLVTTEYSTVEPCYNEQLRTMKMTLLCQISHCIGKQGSLGAFVSGKFLK